MNAKRVILEHMYVCTLNAFSFAVKESHHTYDRSEEADSLQEVLQTLQCTIK